MAAELRRRRLLGVGALGRHPFPRGLYLYTGSAQRNLYQRLRRHLSGPSGAAKKFHWHIDYLLAHARVRYVWAFAAPKEWECRLGGYIARMEGVRVPLIGFGSSDCKCETHLYHIGEDSFHAIPEAILETLSDAVNDNDEVSAAFYYNIEKSRRGVAAATREEIFLSSV